MTDDDESEEQEEQEQDEHPPRMRSRPGTCEPRGMAETLYRHWLMLQQVPRAPAKISVKDLHQRLADMGHEVTKRSVERDLHKLSAAFPLEPDEHKPAGWSWPKTTQAMDVPGMDPHAAITFRLVEQYLAHQLPRSTLKSLEHHFKQARSVLSDVRKDGLPTWANKVRAIPRGQPLLPPKVSSSVLSAVHDALLQGRCLDVTYRNAAGDTKQGEIHPLGLIYRDAVGMLVATWTGYDDIRHYSLHRIEAAKLSANRRKAPAGFSLEQYVESGNASFVIDPKPMKLVVRVDPKAANTLLDTPLSEDQKVVTEPSGWVRVEATVPADTRPLRAFLLGFGALLEVVQPKRLRDEMRNVAADMRSLYSKK